MRAAVEGVIDLSEADLLSPAWHNKLGILMAGMLEQRFEEYNRVMHARALALLTTPGTNVELHARHEVEYLQEYCQQLLFMDADKAATRRSTAQRLRDAWAREFGDPNDPKTRRNIDAVVNALKSRKQEADKERKSGKSIQQQLRHRSSRQRR